MDRWAREASTEAEEWFLYDTRKEMDFVIKDSSLQWPTDFDEGETDGAPDAIADTVPSHIQELDMLPTLTPV